MAAKHDTVAQVADGAALLLRSCTIQQWAEQNLSGLPRCQFVHGPIV